MIHEFSFRTFNCLISFHLEFNIVHTSVTLRFKFKRFKRKSLQFVVLSPPEDCRSIPVRYLSVFIPQSTESISIILILLSRSFFHILLKHSFTKRWRIFPVEWIPPFLVPSVLSIKILLFLSANLKDLFIKIRKRWKQRRKQIENLVEYYLMIMDSFSQIA